MKVLILFFFSLFSVVSISKKKKFTFNKINHLLLFKIFLVEFKKKQIFQYFITF